MIPTRIVPLFIVASVLSGCGESDIVDPVPRYCGTINITVDNLSARQVALYYSRGDVTVENSDDEWPLLLLESVHSTEDSDGTLGEYKALQLTDSAARIQICEAFNIPMSFESELVRIGSYLLNLEFDDGRRHYIAGWPETYQYVPDAIAYEAGYMMHHHKPGISSYLPENAEPYWQLNLDITIEVDESIELSLSGSTEF